MISILEDIITIAGRYRAPSGSCASVGIPSTRTPLSLPDPPSLLTPLLNLGATAQIAEGMNKMFQTRACELRERYHSAISKAQTELDKHDSPHSASTEKQLASALTQCYLKTLREWKEEAITMLQKKLSSLCQKPPAGYPPPKSTSFNHEYIPLLEHFFDENPFPSHADKVFLARKSGMTYRQIHVWFQNRRRRTRKDGKPLRRKPMLDGATLPMDRLIHRMEKYVIPKAPRPQSTSTTAQCSPWPSNPLHTPAPPHAYPSRYPPTCLQDPFPVKNGLHKFPPPQWSRRPSVTLTSRPTVGVDDLIDNFTRLHVRDVDEAGTGLRKGRLHNASMVGSATYAITTTLSKAPHPALLLPPINIPRHHFSGRLPTIAAPSTHDAFEIYNRERRPVTFTFSSSRSREKFKSPFTSRNTRDAIATHYNVASVRQLSLPSPRASSLSSSCSSSDCSDDLFSDALSCVSTDPSTPDDLAYSPHLPWLPAV